MTPRDELLLRVKLAWAAAASPRHQRLLEALYVALASGADVTERATR